MKNIPSILRVKHAYNLDFANFVLMQIRAQDSSCETFL
jgi:hypothetical protein